MSDWRQPNKVTPPPAGATPLAPKSIREVEEAEVITAESPQSPDDGTFKGLPVRVAGDKIWLLKEGRRHWVTSKEIYEKLGFKFGDERETDFTTLMALPEAEPLR